MKIYLQYRTLTTLLNLKTEKQNIRLTVLQRNIIQQYRQIQLETYLKAPLNIQSNDYGKPIALNHHLAFNHSHSQQHYALVFSQDNTHLGVDIEDFSRQVRMQELAEHYFHPNELLNWKNTGEDREFWFKVWTTKEAVLKAHGLGIRLDLQTLDTDVRVDKNFGCIKHEKIGIFYYQNIVFKDSMLTVACEQPMKHSDIILI